VRTIYAYRAATVQELDTSNYRTVDGKHYIMTKLASGIPHFYLLMVGTYNGRVMERTTRKVVGKVMLQKLRNAFGEI
jgi:hypothetical protein